jgi:hypothetical protein
MYGRAFLPTHMSLFDQFQRTTFDTVLRVMGVPCVWAPNGGGATINTTVLLNEPTDKEKVGFVDGYEDVDSSIEFREGQLDGLHESVKSGAYEYVLVHGQRYYVHQVVRRYDGKTLIAYLQSADEPDESL